MVKIDIDASDCKGCGVCVDICPREVFELGEKSEDNHSKEISKPIEEEACIMCLACLEACDDDCISLSDSSSDMII